jgi:small subunit ribosomal protein S21
MPGVKLGENEENVDRALRILRKQVEKAGVINELRKREQCEKPSVRLKKKQAAARKRAKKQPRM